MSPTIAAFGTAQIAVLIVIGLALIPIFVVVHRSLRKVCIAHVRRYCRAHDIEISGWRISPAFDQAGVKTEMTQIEILTPGSSGEQKAFRFTVWVFGIKNVSAFTANSDSERESTGLTRRR